MSLKFCVHKWRSTNKQSVFPHKAQCTLTMDASSTAHTPCPYERLHADNMNSVILLWSYPTHTATSTRRLAGTLQAARLGKMAMGNGQRQVRRNVGLSPAAAAVYGFSF